MRRCWLFVCLAACLAVAGCGRTASQKLEGRWRCAPTEKSDQRSAESAEAEGKAMPLLQNLGARLQMELEFRPDGTVTLTMSTDPKMELWSRKWKVIATEGDRVTLELATLDGQNPRPSQITFVDADHFEFAPPGTGGRVLTFARVESQ